MWEGSSLQLEGLVVLLLTFFSLLLLMCFSSRFSWSVQSSLAQPLWIWYPDWYAAHQAHQTIRVGCFLLNNQQQVRWAWVYVGLPLIPSATAIAYWLLTSKALPMAALHSSLSGWKSPDSVVWGYSFFFNSRRAGFIQLSEFPRANLTWAKTSFAIDFSMMNACCRVIATLICCNH